MGFFLLVLICSLVPHTSRTGVDWLGGKRKGMGGDLRGFVLYGWDGVGS